MQAPTITASFPPTPVAKALAILSKASGEKLAASSVLTDEVLVARLKDAPLDATLAHIAEALCAKWTKQPDGVKYLVPDVAARKRMEDQEEQEGVAALRRSFAYLKKRLGEQPLQLDEKEVQHYKAKVAAAEAKRKAAEAAEDYAHMFVEADVAEEAPAWRAVAQIMPMIGQESILLAMAHQQREVYAENPTPMQHQFPSEATAVIANYRRELNLIDPTLNIARVKVIVLRWETGTQFSAEIEGLDANGKVVDRAYARLADDSELMKIPFTERNKVEPLPNEKPLTIDPECIDARIALANNSKDPKRMVILDKWRPKLSDPVHNEPTSWYQGADFREAADETNRNLIGTVNDFTTGNYWKPEHLTASQLLTKSKLDFLPSNDGWLVVRSHERLSRVSRAEGRAFIKHSMDMGGVTVNDAAAFAAKSPEFWPFINWLGDYLHVLFPGHGPYIALSTTMDGHSLRLWDSLGESVRDNLRTGQTLQLSGLRPEAKAKIAETVYWYGGLDGNNVDPTDRLPNGISDGTISLTIKEMPVVYGWAAKSGPPTTPMPIDAEMLGTSLVSGNSYWEIGPEFYQGWDTYRIGVHREYELHFVIQPGSAPMTISLDETLFDPSAQPVDRLPEAMQKDVEKARAAEMAKPKKAQKKDVIPPQPR